MAKVSNNYLKGPDLLRCLWYASGILRLLWPGDPQLNYPFKLLLLCTDCTMGRLLLIAYSIILPQGLCIAQ